MPACRATRRSRPRPASRSGPISSVPARSSLRTASPGCSRLCGAAWLCLRRRSFRCWSCSGSSRSSLRAGECHRPITDRPIEFLFGLGCVVLVAEPKGVLRIVDPVSLADVSRCVFDHEKPSIGFAPRRADEWRPRLVAGAATSRFRGSHLAQGRAGWRGRQPYS
jgi:hypothetical protein